MPGKLSEAVAYLRTSSATNTGPDKDSERRQREAIHAFAKREGFNLVGEFSDPGVSGADPIAERPGFGQLLDKIEGNGVRIVIVEDASGAWDSGAYEAGRAGADRKRRRPHRRERLFPQDDAADRRRICRIREGSTDRQAAPCSRPRPGRAGPL